ncbi:hypothetical protein YC2023_019099 [Brassica napus]
MYIESLYANQVSDLFKPIMKITVICIIEFKCLYTQAWGSNFKLSNFFANYRKSRRKGKDRRKAQNSTPELRNKSQTPSFNLHRPRSLPSQRSIRDLDTEREQSLRTLNRPRSLPSQRSIRDLDTERTES